MGTKILPQPAKPRKATPAKGRTAKTRKGPNREGNKGSKAPSVSIRSGKDNRAELPLDSLDADAIRDIVGQLTARRESTDRVRLIARDWENWSAEGQGRFWQLWRALRDGGVGDLQTRVGDERYQRPADFVVKMLSVRTGDPDGQCKALAGAADVLARCYAPVDRCIHLQAVESGLRARGLNNQDCCRLLANIKQRLRDQDRELCGTRAVTPGGPVSATAIAQLFLNERYRLSEREASVSGRDDDSAPAAQYGLRYYREAFYRRRKGRWVETGAEDVKLELTEYLQAVAPDQTGVRAVGDVFLNLKAKCAVRVDGDPPLPFHLKKPGRRMLALDNGLLDLSALAEGEKPELLPHDPDWFSTSVLPYGYDAKAKCDQFKEFLGQILNADPTKLSPKTPGDSRARVVQELLGYSLLQDNRFQKFAIFTGPGRNGKGTLFDIWTRMLGPENVANVPLDVMGTRFGTEALVGRLVNLAGDMNQVDSVMEGTLKGWTGQDRMTVPRKYRSDIEVEATLKFVYACNVLPWFKDKSDGIWRRMIVVPFNFTPPPDQVDSDLRAKLAAEMPGILSFALRGLARLLKQDRFTDCSVCAAAATQHREACSPVREFVGDNFTFRSGYGGATEGKMWVTTSTEVARVVKENGETFGDRKLAPHIVCRELAGMPGVESYRPTTVRGRAKHGKVFVGVCVGDPQPVHEHVARGLFVDTGVHELSEFLAVPPKKGRKKSKAVKVSSEKVRTTEKHPGAERGSRSGNR